MRCHTWPPAASAPHMGVRATMSGSPSPAPGWHILIHERAWALSGQNYPYQNATINTFINPTSKSAFFFSKTNTILLQNQQYFNTCAVHPFARHNTYIQIQVLIYRNWSPPVAARSDTPAYHWSTWGRGSGLLLLMALWVMNSVSPRCLVSLSSDLLTQKHS